MNSNMTEQLDQLFRMWDRGLCPGAQVLIRQHGKTLYEKCFGYGNLENKLKIHKESIFHVASISKEFTVLSILRLWKEGKLDLEDDIRKYLNEYINIETPITIRQMMNNVSGLRDQWELLFLRGIKINDQIDMDDINTTISLQKSLNFEPQSQSLYSNTGFHLLALIVEKLSQMSFPQFVKERIFIPLGMTHSFVRESFTQIVPDLTYSYQDEGNDTFYYNPLNYALYGPTSVNTCASDLCKVLDEYIHPNVIDPEIIVRPVEGQIDDLIGEIRQITAKGQRVLVTTLTKKMAESLTEYLGNVGIRVRYLHSDIRSIERMEIIKDLRTGVFDVLVGINLLREGLDLPEVSLVAILDADKAGFLRSETSLIQTIGRAARNVEGRVVMYADEITESMQYAIEETNRRRRLQSEYNRRHHITPKTIVKSVREVIDSTRLRENTNSDVVGEIASGGITKDGGRISSKAPKTKLDMVMELTEEEQNMPIDTLIETLTLRMAEAAGELRYEDAAKIRDTIKKLKLIQ